MTTTAACKGADTNAFFANEGELRVDVRERVTKLAVKYCHDCAFRPTCAATADRRKEPGLWGGYFRKRDGTNYTKTPLLPYLPHYEQKAS